MAQPPQPTYIDDPNAYHVQLLSQEDQEHLIDEFDLHTATAAEKKRLWWKNAVVNALFITSW